MVEGDQARELGRSPFEGPSEPVGPSVPLAGLDVLPPCDPSKLVCVSSNYHGLIREEKHLLEKMEQAKLTHEEATAGDAGARRYPA